MTQTSTRPLQSRPRTWYRDGYIITQDVTRTDFEALTADLSPSTRTKSTLDSKTQYLVLFTPTPLQGESNSCVGYICFEVETSTGKAIVTDLILRRDWRNQGLEDWMVQCAKECSKGWMVTETVKPGGVPGSNLEERFCRS